MNLHKKIDGTVDVDINGTACLLVQNNETVIDFKVGVNCIVPDLFVKKIKLKPLILESGILPSPASTPTLRDSYIKIDGEQVFFVK